MVISQVFSEPVPGAPLTGHATALEALQALGIEAGRVGRWLAGHVDGLVGPVEFGLVSGGRSNLTYRLTDAAGVMNPNFPRGYSLQGTRGSPQV